jgi:hypothetical protein
MTKGKKNEEALNYAQLHDIPQVSIADAKEQILLSWKAKQWRGAFMLVGEAGMGKSQVVHQVAHEVGARVCDIRTAHYGLMGAGIPSTKEAKIGFFKTLLPENFPEGGEKAMVVFDELNQGLPHAISMFFSLIEDRRMFDYLLPKDCMVVGMMNPATDKYSVTQIETNAALRRRLKWLYCIPSFQAWYPHAQSDIFHFSDRDALEDSLPCHPDILSFMETFPALIYDFKAQKVNKQYMCPATIQTISLDTYLMQRNNVSIIGSFAETRFAASIGQTVAKQLVDYLADTTLTVKPEEVLRAYKGKTRNAVKKLAKKDRTKLLDLGQGVLTMLFAKKLPVDKLAKNFVTFLEDHPSEVLMQIHTSLNQMATDNNAQEYLTELMYEMADYPSWRKIHKRLDKNARSVDDDLMKDWKSDSKKKS